MVTALQLAALSLRGRGDAGAHASTTTRPRPAQVRELTGMETAWKSFYPAGPGGQPVSTPAIRSSPSGCGCWAGSLSAAIRK